MYTVYALYNQKAKRIYVGQTQDLYQRMRMHQESTFKNSYTARLKGEWKLIYQESVPIRSEALLREKQLKSHQGREFIKTYIPE